MSRPRRLTSIQALASLNTIAEDDSGGESEREYEALGQRSANLDQVRPTLDVIASDGSDSETDIDTLEQTASCQLETQDDRLTQSTAEIGLVANDGTKWEYIEVASESRGRLQAQNALTEKRPYAICRSHVRRPT